MGDIPKSVALVYDRVNKIGGAEKVLEALHDIFPDAPLYTSVYNKYSAPWAKVFPKVISSFLQIFPFAKSHHEIYPWLTPLAFETLDLSGFDAVVSVTSADAKAVITSPQTFHLCYCLTPTRYLWSHKKQYQNFLDPSLELLSKPVFSYLTYWDKIAASRPDCFISISKTVQDRVKNYYQRDSQIVYPPVDIDVYSKPSTPPAYQNFFLYVSRLVSYKKPDEIINLFNELNLPLVIIGSGHEQNRLKKMARSNIRILGYVNQSELVSYYQHANAFISVHEEDFGIVYAEAQAAGLPIIAVNHGGVKEIVINNQTGQLLDSIPDLKNAIKNFNRSSYNPQLIVDNSKRFSKQRFQSEFVKVFIQEWEKFKNTSLF